MIAHLHGKVAHRSTGRVIVDVGGVGYEALIPTSMQPPAVGAPITLQTVTVIREDSWTLYGFDDDDAKQLFSLLMSASGVGPKLALAAVGALGTRRLALALASGDTDVLQEVPGIGRKSAERLALELRDKVGALRVVGENAIVGTTDEERLHAAPVDDVADALVGLGYSRAEIDDVLAALIAASGGGDGMQEAEVSTDATGDLLRMALRQLGRQR